jgi:diamine N-acetyltransferase
MPRPCASTSVAFSVPMPEIRPACAADAQRLSALARWVWLQTYASDGVRESFAAYVDSAFATAELVRLIGDPTQRLWVVEHEGHLLAWAHLNLSSVCPVSGLTGLQAELSRLYVVPPAAGKGLGSALLRQLRAAAPAHALWLSAWEGNAGALRFYRREQAVPLGETWFELGQERHRNEVLAWPALEGTQ